MPAHMHVPSCPRLLTLLLLGSLSLACDRSSENLPEWSARDHDHQTSPNAAQTDVSAPPAQRPGMPAMEKFGITPVILSAWKQNCTPCHGLIGRGDGPQGAALRPPDLTNPKWQRVAIDSEIAHTIKKGRGRMPGFPSLPDETVEGLIRLIRLMNPERPAEEIPADKPGEKLAKDEAEKPATQPETQAKPDTSPAQ